MSKNFDIRILSQGLLLCILDTLRLNNFWVTGVNKSNEILYTILKVKLFNYLYINSNWCVAFINYFNILVDCTLKIAIDA